MARAISVYVLRLVSPVGEPPRFYVGSSVDPESRIATHRAGRGAAYTKRYPVDSIVSVIAGDRFDEDTTVRRLMAEHGIANVRGGAYSQIELAESDTATLRRELYAAVDACLRCGAGITLWPAVHSARQLHAHLLEKTEKLKPCHVPAADAQAILNLTAMQPLTRKG